MKIRFVIQGSFLVFILLSVFIFKWNAELWCPFGGVEALYSYFNEGAMPCSLGVTNFFALSGVLLLTLFLHRAFCSYICPIGTISEIIRGLAKKTGIKENKVSHKIDRYLSLLKYIFLVIIVYITWQAGELLFRTCDPCYALLSRHGEDITFWAYVVAGSIIVASVFLCLPFCRWFCPLAAVLNPFSRCSITGIKRDSSVCTDCGKCARECPMNIPVDKMKSVTTGRCTSCMTCMDTCPVKSKGALKWGPAWSSHKSWHRTVLVVILFSIISIVVAASYVTPFPAFVKVFGKTPSKTESIELYIKGIKCRGSTNRLIYFLTRDDVSEIPGYMKIEAWPAAQYAKVIITFDPEKADPNIIKEAVIEPYYDNMLKQYRQSPFEIKGFAPWKDS